MTSVGTTSPAASDNSITPVWYKVFPSQTENDNLALIFADSDDSNAEDEINYAFIDEEGYDLDNSMDDEEVDPEREEGDENVGEMPSLPPRKARKTKSSSRLEKPRQLLRKRLVI